MRQKVWVDVSGKRIEGESKIIFISHLYPHKINTICTHLFIASLLTTIATIDGRRRQRK